VLDAAVLMSIGIKKDGERSVLGISVTLSEADTQWRAFFDGLVKHGLCGVFLNIIDDH
jgi:putative transposase